MSYLISTLLGVLVIISVAAAYLWRDNRAMTVSLHDFKTANEALAEAAADAVQRTVDLETAVKKKELARQALQRQAQEADDERRRIEEEAPDWWNTPLPERMRREAGVPASGGQSVGGSRDLRNRNAGTTAEAADKRRPEERK